MLGQLRRNFNVSSCFIHATGCSFNVLGSIFLNFFSFLWSNKAYSDHSREAFAMAVAGPKMGVFPK